MRVAWQLPPVPSPQAFRGGGGGAGREKKKNARGRAMRDPPPRFLPAHRLNPHRPHASPGRVDHQKTEVLPCVEGHGQGPGAKGRGGDEGAPSAPTNA